MKSPFSELKTCRKSHSISCSPFIVLCSCNRTKLDDFWKLFLPRRALRVHRTQKLLVYQLLSEVQSKTRIAEQALSKMSFTNERCEYGYIQIPPTILNNNNKLVFHASEVKAAQIVCIQILENFNINHAVVPEGVCVSYCVMLCLCS